MKKKNMIKVIGTGLICTITATIIGTVGVTPTFAATNKTITIEGQKIAVPSSGNKWIKVKGYWHFVKNGTLVKGWKSLTKSDGEKTTHWSYFDKNNGRLYTGWHYMTSKEGEKIPHWSYFGSNGWLRTGWQQMGKGTNNPDGNANKHWSYFGDNGWLRTGWQTMGTKQNPDGKNKQHTSYFGNNGWLRTGWVQLGKGTSEPDGNSNKHWSYFGDNGWLRTNWQQLGKGTNNPDGNNAKHWSYFGTNGWLRTGLQNMGKGTSNPDGNNGWHQSYFGDNGWLRTNQTVTHKYEGGDIVTYKADSKGWLTFVSVASTPKKTCEVCFQTLIVENNYDDHWVIFDWPIVGMTFYSQSGWSPYEKDVVNNKYFTYDYYKTDLIKKENAPLRKELWGKVKYTALGWDKDVKTYILKEGENCFNFRLSSTILKAYDTWCSEWVKNNIKSNMTQKEKVAKIQNFVTNEKNFTYEASASSVGLYTHGYGDCIAGASLIVDLCKKAGIKGEVKRDYTNYLNHHVAAITIDGKTYRVDGTPGSNNSLFFEWPNG